MKVALETTTLITALTAIIPRAKKVQFLPTLAKRNSGWVEVDIRGASPVVGCLQKGRVEFYFGVLPADLGTALFAAIKW